MSIATKPQLFTSAYVEKTLDGTLVNGNTFSEALDTNIESTSSFRYDPPGVGIKSTQQLNVDFSRFENHTFFNSAEVNVNVAFDRIINNYPFDGTRKEIEVFFDSLTGFEKYVYDSFPKNKGFLIFSGSSATVPVGSYIQVEDFAGSLFPSLSKLNTAETVLDPGAKSISFEMQIHVPAEANDNQIVLQKIAGSTQGLTLALSRSATTTECEVHFSAVSASVGLLASASLSKGTFNHVVATLNRRPGVNRLQLFVNEVLVTETTDNVEFGKFGFTINPLLIGSGSTVSFSRIPRLSSAYPSSVFTPILTFSGSIDEFRVFHDVRTLEQQKQYARRAIYASPELKLYYKFNEPLSASQNDPGALTMNTSRIVLDSSGNSLHGVITNFSSSLKVSGTLVNPMTNESLSLCPVLFPAYNVVADLNVTLLASASAYDAVNPNIITRLIPKHYFYEGQAFENFENENGPILDRYSSGTVGIPGDGDLGSAQVMSTLLYTYAKFFDEMKLYTDAFSRVQYVDYDSDDTVPSQFLPQLIKHYGFDIPNFFPNSTIEQYIDGDDILQDFSQSSDTLQYVQNQIWRRILINIQEIIKSKGTLHAVKSFIRVIGIEPDSNFRIKEYGGSTRRELQEVRQLRAEPILMLDMSGTNEPIIVSPYLSASRNEIGWPHIRGAFVNKTADDIHGISNNKSDGLFTSGSWAYEALYKYPADRPLTVFTQSLFRLNITGSSALFLTSSIEPKELTVINLLAILPLTASSNIDVPRLEMVMGNYGYAANEAKLKLTIPNINIFDGDYWNVSVGRFRADDPAFYGTGSVITIASSSYFLRCAKQSYGEIIENYVTSSFMPMMIGGAIDTLQIIGNSTNPSGTFISIGSQSLAAIDTGVIDAPMINNVAGTYAMDAYTRETRYKGLVGNIRFWSKGVTSDEWNEHVRNPRSLGVEHPLTNFNFLTVEKSGSFGRLRVDASADQPVTASDAYGSIELFDFSQNRLHFSGSRFDASTEVIEDELVQYSIISPNFDDSVSNDKVRVRGYQALENIEKFNAEASPVYDISPNESSNDDARFSIDFSIVDKLNEDIINIFATFDELDNVLGNPELMFSCDYPDLENLREIYFKRLSSRLNIRGFFEFFRWFDQSVGIFIKQLLPGNTRYLGTNFIIEPHMLERSKLAYMLSDIYLSQNVRSLASQTRARQQSADIANSNTRAANDRRGEDTTRTGKVSNPSVAISDINGGMKKY